MTRRAGVLVPLFSIPSTRSWGIGEIGDLDAITHWLSASGQQILQLLPINEMPAHESSPYSALSSMAIDPQFVSLADVEDFVESGGEAAMDSRSREQLDDVRSASRIQYGAVRRLKHVALDRAFRRFLQAEWGTGSRRERRLRAFIEEHASWLNDYALFCVLRARFGQTWTGWPEPLRRRVPETLADARSEFSNAILFRQYIQWQADSQWQAARARAHGMALFGDLPFMVGIDSVDVWTHQDEFRLDASVGVPPDAFSSTGQDWGLPLYRWDVLAERDFDWLRERARRNATLFDAYRVDHLVGFYRTYFRPHDGSAPQFTPADEASQLALGERVMAALRESGPALFAEDLGVVPEFVRDSLTRQSIAGYKVFRWERHWNVQGQPFRDPADYPPVSVATSGTHDTEPLVTWWEHVTREERQAILDIPSVRSRWVGDARDISEPRLPPAVHAALLESLFASASETLILPLQDVFAWPDRINQPATVSDLNWTWRLPWPSDRISSEPVCRQVGQQLRAWSDRYGRTVTRGSESWPKNLSR